MNKMSSFPGQNERREASLHASSVSRPSSPASHRALSMMLPLLMSAFATTFSPLPLAVTKQSRISSLKRSGRDVCHWANSSCGFSTWSKSQTYRPLSTAALCLRHTPSRPFADMVRRKVAWKVMPGSFFFSTEASRSAFLMSSSQAEEVRRSSMAARRSRYSRMVLFTWSLVTKAVKVCPEQGASCASKFD